MNVTEARDLAFTLRRRNPVGTDLSAVVVVPQRWDTDLRPHDVADQREAVVDADGRTSWQLVVGGRIVFKGGPTGEHSLDLRASSAERILAHWEGYCAANGLLKPEVGQRVVFPSGSSPDGLRYGIVVSVGSKRARIAFKYKHGGKSEKSVPFNEIRFSPRGGKQ